MLQRVCGGDAVVRDLLRRLGRRGDWVDGKRFARVLRAVKVGVEAMLEVVFGFLLLLFSPSFRSMMWMLPKCCVRGWTGSVEVVDWVEVFLPSRAR